MLSLPFHSPYPAPSCLARTHGFLWPWRVLCCAAIAVLTPSASLRAATFIEAESSVARSATGSPDRKFTAYGGACLGNDWGSRDGDWAEYAFEAPGGETSVFVRYAWQNRSGNTSLAAMPPRLRVRCNGAEQVVVLPETGAWDVWNWARVPLGVVNAGAQTLRLEALQSDAPLNLDALVVARAGETPAEVKRPLIFEGSRHIRIQLSPGVKPLETDKLFAIGEATYGFLRDYLGEEPAQRLTVHVIARAEQRDEHVGHSIGYAIYLEEARILDTGHNWVHEITHCFQRGGAWPTWLSEGEAWLTYYEAESALFGRSRQDIAFSPSLWRQRLPQARATLIVDGRNELQKWGQPGFPATKTRAAYDFANHILAELHQRYGPSLMRRYRALVREEIAREESLHAQNGASSSSRSTQLSIEQRDGVVVDRLSRAAGADLRPLFV
ncbi:MAG: C-terminal domain, partial [Abditibacteriota bacterium]|nr:C-terminal domain [Abditibacteriota bacterium]